MSRHEEIANRHGAGPENFFLDPKQREKRAGSGNGFSEFLKALREIDTAPQGEDFNTLLLKLAEAHAESLLPQNTRLVNQIKRKAEALQIRKIVREIGSDGVQTIAFAPENRIDFPTSSPQHRVAETLVQFIATDFTSFMEERAKTAGPFTFETKVVDDRTKYTVNFGLSLPFAEVYRPDSSGAIALKRFGSIPGTGKQLDEYLARFGEVQAVPAERRSYVEIPPRSNVT